MACAHSGWNFEMARKRIFWPLAAALALAGIGLALAPDAFDAAWLLVAQDDPVMLADRAVDKRFSAPVAEREIAAALKADDVDLANSFADLAAERGVALRPDVAAQVTAANSTAARASRNVEHFTRGLVPPASPTNIVGLAGTTLGDLFVFGDLRDGVREGGRLARGEKADELILGLACLGVAVTAATYVSLGAGTPARVGLSLVKAARKTERLGAGMASWVGRSSARWWMRRRCAARSRVRRSPSLRSRWAASWTHKLDSEKKQEHDFSNLILECRYAIQRQDQMMTEFCENELSRMYRERRRQKRQRCSMLAKKSP